MAADLNYLSLFSGIGGLDLGLDRAGMTCVGQVEKDEFCRRVLAKHWPEVPRHDDVRTVPNWWDARTRPAVHVVAGGFPCQPFSLAGRQLGAEDERYLWPALMDVVRHLRPTWVLLENVPGLLQRGLGDVLGDLAAGGYDAEWDCVPAASIGAPHRRDRVFIVAYPAGHRRGPGRAGRPAGEGADGAHVPASGLADNDGEQGRPLVAALAGGGGGTLGGGSPEPRRRGGTVADSDRKPKVWTSKPRPERDHWATEPDVGRVAHGVPAGVDRLRALGNAVVPQVGEHVGRLVVAAANALTNPRSAA